MGLRPLGTVAGAAGSGTLASAAQACPAAPAFAPPPALPVIIQVSNGSLWQQTEPLQKMSQGLLKENKSGIFSL